MIDLKFKAMQSGFFDRGEVLRALGRAKAKVFREFGRLVRKRAQKSLVYSDKVSAPLGPPHVHKSGLRRRVSKSTGKVRIRAVSPLREFLFFAWDRTRESVVIGPAKLGRGIAGAGAPAALEYGGTSIGVDPDTGRRRRQRTAARPFMRPALEAERPQLPRLWRDSVR